MLIVNEEETAYSTIFVPNPIPIEPVTEVKEAHVYI